jgi:hypothetical protein
LSSTAGFDFCSSLLLNKPVNQPHTPVLASAGLAMGFVLRAWAGAWALTGAAGLGKCAGAGASGNTPLITGVCLFVGSCERRVTAVGSSNSSAIL